jgi:integrase/recombinase XerD
MCRLSIFSALYTKEAIMLNSNPKPVHVLTATQLAKRHLKEWRQHRADYEFSKQYIKIIRAELAMKINAKSKRLPRVPSTEEIGRLKNVIWSAKNHTHMIMMKVFIYTGVRINELINIKLDDIDYEACQIRIVDGKGGKDRQVPFLKDFREALGMHAAQMKKEGARYLFESSWKKQFSLRGIRNIVYRYAELAGIEGLSPHKLRHFLFTFLKKQGIDDALIQPFSGHSNRQTLEVYSRLSIVDAQHEYNKVISQIGF